MLAEKLYEIYKAYKEKDAVARREYETVVRRFNQKFGHLTGIHFNHFREDEQFPDVLPESLEEFWGLGNRKDADRESGVVAGCPKEEGGLHIDREPDVEENLQPNGHANLPSGPGLKMLEEFDEPFDNPKGGSQTLQPEFTTASLEETAQNLDVDVENQDCIGLQRVSKAVGEFQLEDQPKGVEAAQVADQREEDFFQALSMVRKSEEEISIAKGKVSTAEKQETSSLEQCEVASLKDGIAIEVTSSLGTKVVASHLQQSETSTLLEESDMGDSDCNAVAGAGNGVQVEKAGSEFLKVLATKRKRGSPLIVPDFITVFDGVPGAITTMYQCKVCKRRKFRSASNFRLHAFCGMEEHLKPFQCDHCVKGFVYESHYRRHLRLHSKEKFDTRIRKIRKLN